MRRFAYILILVCISSLMMGQRRFKPYSTHGIEISGAFNAIAQNPNNLKDWNGKKGLGPRLDQYHLTPEIKWNYDYAPYRMLGVGTGLGFSVRGGGRIIMYYLNVPLRAQFKAGFFWFEPSLQANLLIGSNVIAGHAYFNDEHVKRINLNYNLIGRFNLFKGLSLHGGIEGWITPVAYFEYPYSPDITDTYYQFSFIIGARYMFSQPSRIKR